MRFKKRRRTFRKGKKSLKKRVSRIQRVVRSFQKSEVRWTGGLLTHQDINNVGTTTGGSGFSVTDPIVQGDNNSQREGNQIRLLSLQIRGRIYTDQVWVSGATQPVVRIIVFCVRNIPSSTIVALSDPATWLSNWSLGSETAVMGFIKPEYKGMVKILKDKYYSMAGTAANGVSNLSQRTFQFNVPLKSVGHTKYNGSGASTVIQNGVYVYAMCNTTVGTAGAQKWSYAYKMTFVP